MSGGAFATYLAQGGSDLCRIWRITRRDGVVLGLSDHDRDLRVDGLLYQAGAGFDARAVQRATGLAVDNSEVSGALSHAGIREEDLAAGRYDGAEIRLWLLVWSAPDLREELFCGTLGEVSRQGLAFRGELRGFSAGLNQPRGRLYGRDCAAALGDQRCGFDLATPGYSHAGRLQALEGRGLVLTVSGGLALPEGWFVGGSLRMQSGPAQGLCAMIRQDRLRAEGREVTLWQTLGVAPGLGDLCHLTAGCDRRFATCRTKFANSLNFQGFPHLPDEDWLSALPPDLGQSDG